MILGRGPIGSWSFRVCFRWWGGVGGLVRRASAARGAGGWWAPPSLGQALPGHGFSGGSTRHVFRRVDPPGVPWSPCVSGWRGSVPTTPDSNHLRACTPGTAPGPARRPGGAPSAVLAPPGGPPAWAGCPEVGVEDLNRPRVYQRGSARSPTEQTPPVAVNARPRRRAGRVVSTASACFLMSGACLSREKGCCGGRYGG